MSISERNSLKRKSELMPLLEAVLASGMHIGGQEVDALELEIAEYLGCQHVVALNSGNDALIFGLVAARIEPGDQVINPPNSFVASTAAIVRAGAIPVFADVRTDGLIDPDAVEAAITPRTAAIMPVHLWGGICDMDALQAIAGRHGLAIIEDAAAGDGHATPRSSGRHAWYSRLFLGSSAEDFQRRRRCRFHFY